MGLSIPYDFYKGALVLPEGEPDATARQSNEHIARFAQYLETLQQDPTFEAHIDTESLRRDVEAGLYFDSSIPLGYGVGSSGALVAAIYERYASPRKKPEELTTGTSSA